MHEKHCVGILLREPELVYKVDRALSRDGLARFCEKDFQNADFQILIKIIKEALDQAEEEPRDYIITHLPDDFEQIVDELLVMSQDLNPNAEKVLEDLMRAFLNLRKWQLAKQNDHYRYLQERDHENGDYKSISYQKFILESTKIEHKIDIALKRLTSRTAAFDS
jgi:hypothetical protein